MEVARRFRSVRKQSWAEGAGGRRDCRGLSPVPEDARAPERFIGLVPLSSRRATGALNPVPNSHPQSGFTDIKQTVRDAQQYPLTIRRNARPSREHSRFQNGLHSVYGASESFIDSQKAAFSYTISALLRTILTHYIIPEPASKESNPDTLKRISRILFF